MMRPTLSVLACALVAGIAALVAVPEANAQLRFDRGQSVAPVFEGWERNLDGSFTMVFGYMNRNYEEMPDVPVGPDNFFEPGPADRGQPARFYNRRQQFVFRVTVPSDWGDKDLVWTLTSHGETEQAFATLIPSWEIDDGVIKANRGGGLSGAPADNQRPSISIVGGTEHTITLPEPLTITAVLGDDGIPGDTPQRDRSGDTQQQIDARRLRESRRHPTNQAIVDARTARDTGLGVTWVHYRGPGRVSFAPMSAQIEGGRGGEATTTVTFTNAGTHVLRAYADDSINTTPIDITVTVN